MPSSMPSTQNFSKITVTIIRSVVQQIKTKCGTCDLSNAHQLECWMCELMLVMHSIATMDLITHYFWLTLSLVNM